MEDVEGEAGIYACESDYLECHVQLGIAQGRVLAVDFPTSKPDEATTEHELLDRIRAYLEGEADDFAAVPVALTVPTGQREVLETVRGIPYATEVTVEQVARMTASLTPDEPDDIALVREALAANPAPLFIPDHRVRDGPGAAPAGIEQKLRAVEGI